MMTKRNASEYIKGSVRLYRDTHARYCRGRAKLRWACPSSVVHSSVACRGCRRVSCIPSGAACSKYLLRPAYACNIPMRYTDTRDAYIPKRDTYIASSPPRATFEPT